MKDVTFMYKIVFPLLVGMLFLIVGGVELGAMMGAVIYIMLEFADYAYWTPDEAKILKEAKRKGATVVVREQDNHVALFSYTVDVRSSGAVKTNDGWIGFIARPAYESFEPEVQEQTNSLVDEKKKKVRKRDLISAIRKLTTSTAFLRSAKVPILFATEGKAVLTNIPTISNLTYANETGVHNIPEKVVAAEAVVSHSPPTFQVAFPVSFTDLKPHVPQTWDENEVQSDRRISEAIGAEEERERMQGKNDKKLFYFAIIVFIGGLVLAALAVFN
jgi:hypothetical protein